MVKKKKRKRPRKAPLQQIPSDYVSERLRDLTQAEQIWDNPNVSPTLEDIVRKRA